MLLSQQEKLQHPCACNNFSLHEHELTVVSIQELSLYLTVMDKMPLTQFSFLTVDRKDFSPLLSIMFHSYERMCVCPLPPLLFPLPPQS